MTIEQLEAFTNAFEDGTIKVLGLVCPTEAHAQAILKRLPKGLVVKVNTAECRSVDDHAADFYWVDESAPVPKAPGPFKKGDWVRVLYDQPTIPKRNGCYMRGDPRYHTHETVVIGISPKGHAMVLCPRNPWAKGRYSALSVLMFRQQDGYRHNGKVGPARIEPLSTPYPGPPPKWVTEALQKIRGKDGDV